MLKLSVQTFYQTLFSIFPSAILFPSKSFSHQKAQTKVPKDKSQAKSPKAQSKAPKAKGPLPPSGVFYSTKQGGATGRGMTL
jgi:hypothetical protein